MGVMSKIKYRQKWYGEAEDTAAEKAAAVTDSLMDQLGADDENEGWRFGAIFRKKVSLSLIDGKEFEGVFTSLIPDYDTDSGKAEVEIFSDHTYFVIPIDEVETITKLEEWQLT